MKRRTVRFSSEVLLNQGKDPSQRWEYGNCMGEAGLPKFYQSTFRRDSRSRQPNLSHFPLFLRPPYSTFLPSQPSSCPQVNLSQHGRPLKRPPHRHQPLRGPRDRDHSVLSRGEIFLQKASSTTSSRYVETLVRFSTT